LFPKHQTRDRKQKNTPVSAQEYSQTVSQSVTTKGIGYYLDKHARFFLLLPALVLLVGLFGYPIFYTIDLSLRDVNLFNIQRGDAPFVGLDNYVQVLTDPAIWNAFYLTTLFFGVSLILQLTLGMVLALIFNRAFVGKSLLMTICLVPLMVTPIAVGMFWRLMLNAQWGVINYLLSLVGIPPQPWLGDTTLVQIAVIGVYVWLDVAFVFLVFLGGLTALPVEPFEAAAMDGASAVQTFRFITLPLLTPIILVIVITRIIDAFRAFDVIYALTEGGPGDSTRVVALELYKIAFRRLQYSDAAALAILMSVLMIVLTALLLRALRYRSAGNA
jgi:multiple sugar transport system permease protein